MKETYVFRLYRYDDLDRLKKEYGDDFPETYISFALVYIRHVLFPSAKYAKGGGEGYRLTFPSSRPDGLKGWMIISMEYWIPEKGGMYRVVEDIEDAVKAGRVIDLTPEKHRNEYLVFRAVLGALMAVANNMDLLAKEIRDTVRPFLSPVDAGYNI